MSELVAEPEAPAPRRTQAEMIRQTLEDRIVHGFLQPGSSLDEAAIAAEFGISRTPVREAIRQLEANGFATSRPRCGAIVTSFTADELKEIFLVMSELESVCARLAATAMNGAELDALALLHHRGVAHVQNGAIDAYRTHNERFHNALYAGAHNAFLEDTTRNVRRRLAPFRNMQFEALDRIEASQREHGLIVAAIVEGDAEAAGIRMRAHILTVQDTVAAAIRTPARGSNLSRPDHAIRQHPPSARLSSRTCSNTSHGFHSLPAENGMR